MVGSLLPSFSDRGQARPVQNLAQGLVVVMSIVLGTQNPWVTEPQLSWRLLLAAVGFLWHVFPLVILPVPWQL